nr:hypothetical protein AIIDPAOG_00004 [Gallid alphaherpesvirus 2]WOL21011.1 hypothetical protein GFCMFDBG_00005 [Gallid alphaherpesvirus 2]WOL21197.1 hypothetical protein PIKIBBIB_00005 [Gallid alphaherpesvirus 2]WOL21581.1 hypothetical protein BMMJLCPH_00006 [Gallid alphaherpesvirus 2]WOL21693.1 hypothetical protein DMEEGDKK_00007 [Gallid alphaherpesvirus 2]
MSYEPRSVRSFMRSITGVNVIMPHSEQAKGEESLRIAVTIQ